MRITNILKTINLEELWTYLKRNVQKAMIFHIYFRAKQGAK